MSQKIARKNKADRTWFEKGDRHLIYFIMRPNINQDDQFLLRFIILLKSIDNSTIGLNPTTPKPFLLPPQFMCLQ